MKKTLWMILCVCVLMCAWGSVLADGVPLASETVIEPVLSAEELVGLKIPVDYFKETTGGGEVVSAELKTSETDENVQYIEVFGYIYPVDPQAPNIEWEMLLPLQWNGRTVQLGGGANNGWGLVSGYLCGREIAEALGYSYE